MPHQVTARDEAERVGTRLVDSIRSEGNFTNLSQIFTRRLCSKLRLMGLNLNALENFSGFDPGFFFDASKLWPRGHTEQQNMSVGSHRHCPMAKIGEKLQR